MSSDPTEDLLKAIEAAANSLGAAETIVILEVQATRLYHRISWRQPRIEKPKGHTRD